MGIPNVACYTSFALEVFFTRLGNLKIRGLQTSKLRVTGPFFNHERFTNMSRLAFRTRFVARQPNGTQFLTVGIKSKAVLTF